MGGEYNQEVLRRLLRDGPHNCRNLEPPRLRRYCQEDDQREREEVWLLHINERFRTILDLT
jgi:hypothetical protein